MSDLILYRINKRDDFVVRKSPRERDWMDNTHVKYAYRCLPLAIANQHGWELSVKSKIRFLWDGGDKINSIKVIEGPENVVSSHFGYGIITFVLDFLIRSEENISLFVSGSPNCPKRGIYPLTGIVETDWNPATFTMNWQITEPNRIIEFEAFEPICHFFPVQRGFVDNTKVIIRSLDSNETEKSKYDVWSNSRDKVNKEGTGEENGWEKHYFQGVYHGGAKCPVNHQTKLKINDPIEEN